MDKVVDPWLFDVVIKTSSSMKAIYYSIQHYDR